MATPAQIAANQTNAKKSTCPRTEAGKQQGATEQILVNKMAEQFWLQKRAAYYLAQHTDYNEGAKEESEEIVSMKQMALYLRYCTTAERAFNRNLHDLRRIQKDRRQYAPVTEIGSVPQNAQPPESPVQTAPPATAKPVPVEPIFALTDLPEPARPHEKAA
jgi:hypothetical protein